MRALPRIPPRAVLGAGLLLLAICLFPFWGPIATAAVFAFGFRGPVDRLRARLGAGRPLVGALAVAALLIVLLFPVTFLGLRVYALASAQKERGAEGVFSSQTLGQVTTALSSMEAEVSRLATRTGVARDANEVRRNLRSGAARAAGAVGSALSGAVLQLPELVLSLLVFALFFYFFLARGPRVGEELARTGLLDPADVSRLAEVLRASCYRTLVTNILVGLVQAGVITLGARLCGFGESVLIFTAVFFLSFIPFIGASPVAFLLAVVAFVAGHTGNGVGMLVTGVIGGTIDNVIRPWLVADGDGDVHPAIAFAAILGAIAIFGIKGLFLGPVILTATVRLLRRQEKSADQPAPARGNRAA